MGLERYLSPLDQDGQLLVAAARQAGPQAPVPTCPGWTVGDLLRHTSFVHRWAAGYVEHALVEMVPEPSEDELARTGPADEELMDWAEESHQHLVSVLRAAAPDVQCWTFLPAPSPLEFWARRQAHETAVHRVDAQLAAAMPLGTVRTELALDGIDELLFGFLSRRRRPAADDARPARVHLEDTVSGRGWSLLTGAGWLEASAAVPGEAAAAELTVRGAAGDLYLWLWNRRPAAGLEVAGRVELLDAWKQQFRVRWS
jgi:uncharacterized protein (TIGR03083 family)